MTLDPNTYPSRSFIRFSAQNQLRADLTGQSFTAVIKRSGGESYVQQVAPRNSADSVCEVLEDTTLDEALFEEIARTTFTTNRYPELYQSCGTQSAAKAVEARVAAELVETYLQITLKQRCPIVQSLNNRL
jgi:DNA-binding GntR family transcriptional regulator